MCLNITDRRVVHVVAALKMVFLLRHHLLHWLYTGRRHTGSRGSGLTVGNIQDRRHWIVDQGLGGSGQVHHRGRMISTAAPPRPCFSCGGPCSGGGGRAKSTGLCRGAAKSAGLRALFLGVLGAAPARRRRWRINPAPGRAKTSDFVVFAHRRRPALGCIARALAALVRFLALPLLFLALSEGVLARALAGCHLRVLIARRRRRRRRRDGNRRRRRRRDGNRRWRRRRDGNRRRRR